LTQDDEKAIKKVKTNKTAELKEFSASTVRLLIQFIYTFQFDLSGSLETMLDLYILGDYTTNEYLCKYLGEHIIKQCTLDSEIEILFYLRQKPLKLRKDAIEYFHKHKDEIKKSTV
jgi:hypothetical protein